MQDEVVSKDIEQKKRSSSPKESEEQKRVKLEADDSKSQEQHITTAASSSDISSSPPIAVSEEENKQQSEEVIAATNAAVETLHGGRIVRLDTSALFSEENWRGIKEVFKLLGDISTKAASIYQDYQDVTLENLDVEEKILILKILGNDFKINFTLTKDGASVNLNQLSLSNDKDNLSVLDPSDNDGERLVNLENTDFLKANGYKIELGAQLYHHAYKMIVIDADREKCPADAEFHEKVHLLDDMLLPGDLHCSTRGFIELAEQNNISSEAQKEILHKLITVTAPEVLAPSYNDAIDKREDGIKFGGTEVIAFALQNRALERKPDLDILDSQDVLTLKSMLDSFQQEVVKQGSLVKLSEVCQSFSHELGLLSTSKATSETLTSPISLTTNQASKAAIDSAYDELMRSIDGIGSTLTEEDKELKKMDEKTQKLEDQHESEEEDKDKSSPTHKIVGKHTRRLSDKDVQGQQDSKTRDGD
jgi:hypothetical protein